MDRKHKKLLKLENHLQNMVGQPFYKKKPSNKLILESLLNGLANMGFTGGTCWMPVSRVEKGKSVEWNLIFNQCPGACGKVWELKIKNENVGNWFVNEINQRRFGKKK